MWILWCIVVVYEYSFNINFVMITYVNHGSKFENNIFFSFPTLFCFTFKISFLVLWIKSNHLIRSKLDSTDWSLYISSIWLRRDLRYVNQVGEIYWQNSYWLLIQWITNNCCFLITNFIDLRFESLYRKRLICKRSDYFRPNLWRMIDSS